MLEGYPRRNEFSIDELFIFSLCEYESNYHLRSFIASLFRMTAGFCKVPHK